MHNPRIRDIYVPTCIIHAYVLLPDYIENGGEFLKKILLAHARQTYTHARTHPHMYPHIHTHLRVRTGRSTHARTHPNAPRETRGDSKREN